MSHHSSIFAQLLRLVPRHAFEKLAQEHHAGAPLRGRSRWKQFVALVAGQITGARACATKPALGPAGAGPGGGDAARQGPRLDHLGAGPVARSSLARRGAEQPAALFATLFERLVAATATACPGHRFRLEGRLLSFDAR